MIQNALATPERPSSGETRSLGPRRSGRGARVYREGAGEARVRRLRPRGAEGEDPADSVPVRTAEPGDDAAQSSFD